jgi:membrane protease YdiL (CAAX protease family)
MTYFELLKQKASQTPFGTFLAVLAAYSALVVIANYAVFGADFPVLASVPYAWGPMISAGATVWIRDESIRDWLGQLGRLRGGVHWYIGGLAIVLIGTDFETIVASLIGVDVVVQAGSSVPLTEYLFYFAVTLFLAGSIEELGWRGFLQPRLQRRFRAVTASVAIGIVWALWHVPMMLAGAGTFAGFPQYILMTVALSVVLGWLYNNTDGALPVVMVTHAASNMATIGRVTGDLPVVFEILSGNVIFYLLCAALIALYAGSRTLTRDGTTPEIPGSERSL